MANPSNNQTWGYTPPPTGKNRAARKRAERAKAGYQVGAEAPQRGQQVSVGTRGAKRRAGKKK